MSMGAVLKQVRDHLRDALSLGVDQCGIQPDGVPPDSADEFYLAVNEMGVTSTAREHLLEEYEIEVSVWRRAGGYPADRRGDVQLSDDPYLAGILTLDDLERAVIRNLHGNYDDITVAANTAIGAGVGDGGDVFQLALYYAGRRGTEILQTGKEKHDPTWFGRRLKFVGMTRVQSISMMQ